MLSRTALRRVGVPHARLSPQLAGSAARQLSYASTRPSITALGKRPLPSLSGPTGAGSALSSRQFSWTPWRKDVALADEEQPLASTSASTSTSTATTAPTPEPVLTESHPDLGASTTSQALPASSSSPADHLTSSSELLPQPPADIVTPTLEDLILNSGKTLEEVLNSQEAVHAAMKVSDLKLMGYEHGFFSISGWFTDAIVGIHTQLGVPWWGTIALITVAIRLCLSPLLISTQKHNARLAKVNPDIQELMTKAKEAKENKDLHAQTMISQALQGLMRDHNVHPLRVLLMPLVQMPIFLTFFSIIRGLANLPLPQLKEGGIGWVTDLTVADPYYILPLTSLVFTNLVFKFGADGMNTEMKSGSPQRTAHIRNFIQLATFMSLPIVAYFPAAILFYWTFSTGFTLLQSLILRIPAIKRMLGLPATPKPAEGFVKAKDPSYMDSFRAIQGWWQESMDRATVQHAARMQEMEAAKRSGYNSQNSQQSQAGFVERISESSEAPTPSSPTSTSKATAAAAAATTTSQRRIPVDPRLAEKQRRIEQARQKRARQ